MNPNRFAMNLTVCNLDNFIRFDIMALGKTRVLHVTALDFFFLYGYNGNMPTTKQDFNFQTDMDALYALYIEGRTWREIKLQFHWKSNNSVRRLKRKYPAYQGEPWRIFVEKCRSS